MLSRYSELQEGFRRQRRLQRRAEGHDRPARPRLLRKTTWRSRPRRSRAAGRCASRSRKLLLGRPGLLLLDEPTNHLDLDARNWLEEYLSDYPHAVILVSHDRFFLDAVVTRITEIGMRTLTDYVGNYSAYLKERDARMERLRQHEARPGRRDRADAGVHQPLPLPGDQGGAGAEPDQDARQDRPHRDPARAQARPLHISRRREERADGARAEARPQGVRRDARVRRRQPAHRARRSHRADRPERRRQVDADADAVGRRGAGHRARAPRGTRS